MAKISPTSIKYTITADFESEGPVEKPDVIGALFGQTEGLLGHDMELRELQKEGKIGRIDVELRSEGGKTKGEIVIPSALDKTETTIIAAALETVDKIGPTDAKITVLEIEDVRGSKRDYIMERAKKLLANIKNPGKETSEIEAELRESTRVSKISEYGEERLPAGDLSEREIIVVEGRADVVNLLRHGVKNVIGMNGTRLPAEIAKLGKEKEITLFVDGDRGGKLIAKNVCENANVTFVCTAPDGKEVEELTGKEILQALRKKIPAGEFAQKADFPKRERAEEEEKPARILTADDREKIRKIAEEARGKNVLILDSKLNVLNNIPSSKLNFIRADNAFILVTSAASSAIIAGAEKLGAKYVAARTFGKIPEDTNVELISI